MQQRCFLSPPERPKITFRQCTSTDICVTKRDGRALAKYLLELKQFILDYNEICREKGWKNG